MKIGVDMDDVLVEYVKAFLKFYNHKNRANLEYDSFTNIENSVDPNNDFFNSEFFEEIEITENAKEVIKNLAEKNSLFIVTSRQIEWKEKTKEFIDEHFPDCFKSIFHTSDIHAGGGKKKIDFYQEMDIVIEDNRNHSIGCANAGVKVLLLKKPWNRGISHSNIIEVENWKDIESEINSLYKSF